MAKSTASLKLEYVLVEIDLWEDDDDDDDDDDVDDDDDDDDDDQNHDDHDDHHDHHHHHHFFFRCFFLLTFSLFFQNSKSMTLEACTKRRFWNLRVKDLHPAAWKRRSVLGDDQVTQKKKKLIF